ncbi:MAG: hypothetical protein HZA93_05190 [Verrucomicrobia bacterium]|nr:hypothetical protein [Verrucomicrobiota bacterium]
MTHKSDRTEPGHSMRREASTRGSAPRAQAASPAGSGAALKRAGGRFARWPALALVALLAGCAGVELVDPTRQGPFFTPTNQAGLPGLGGMRRVVLLPVCGGTLAPEETVASFDPLFVAALQQENRFEVVTLSREECLRKFRAREFSSAAALPPDFLAKLKEEYAADGVLFVDLTVFSAYRPIAIGLRGKLARIDGTALVWTFDNVFSAEDPAVANSARRFYRGSDRGGVPVDLSQGVLQSPNRFAGYAAAAMFSTLPPVVPPAPAPATKRLSLHWTHR